MSRLTVLGIRRAKAKSSVNTLSDGRGLSLRIEPSGVKLWHFRFYWQNKQQRSRSVGYRVMRGDRRIVLGIRLLLLTAVRPGELRYAEPDHFDLVKGGNVPSEQVKQLQRLALSLPKGAVPPFVVPLPRQAIEIVEELLRLRFHGQKYLLPHRSEPQLCISENSLNQCLRRLGFKDRLTTHGTRATISTSLNELGYPREWIEERLCKPKMDSRNLS